MQNKICITYYKNERVGENHHRRILISTPLQLCLFPLLWKAKGEPCGEAANGHSMAPQEPSCGIMTQNTVALIHHYPEPCTAIYSCITWPQILRISAPRGKGYLLHLLQHAMQKSHFFFSLTVTHDILIKLIEKAGLRPSGITKCAAEKDVPSRLRIWASPSNISLLGSILFRIRNKQLWTPHTLDVFSVLGLLEYFIPNLIRWRAFWEVCFACLNRNIIAAT